MSRQLCMEGDANGVAGKNGVPAELLPGVWPAPPTLPGRLSVPPLERRRSGSGNNKRKPL